MSSEETVISYEGRSIAGLQGHKFDTFIFDLDGTLLETLPDLVVLTNTALAEFGFPPRTTDEIRSFVGNGGRALVNLAVPEGTSEEKTAEVMQHWKDLYSVIGNKLTTVYPHIEETMTKLREKGILLGVLSNKFEEGVFDVMGEYLPNLFDVMHGESEEIPRKPNPAGLLRTIEELGSAPERCVYVGDSAGDVLVSQRAGTYSVGVSWGYHDVDSLKQAGADLIIDDPRDLLQLVEKGEF